MPIIVVEFPDEPNRKSEFHSVSRVPCKWEQIILSSPGPTYHVTTVKHLAGSSEKKPSPPAAYIYVHLALGETENG